ncbi:phage portal protein [Komagataeibacter diospyri]|uniref:phage portal protein n=1 Tax=Komagataeibacter diospyri TaxID=1932662 RepID=UPI003756A527
MPILIFVRQPSYRAVLPVQRPRPRRAAALNGGFGQTPYDAADITSPHMAAWNPLNWSPDVELNVYRDRIVARIRDLVRNDGWASGAITRVLDNAIGGTFRPITKRDYRSLRVRTGYSFDAMWAEELAREIDAHWRCWAEDEDRFCDAGCRLTFTQMMWVSATQSILIQWGTFSGVTDNGLTNGIYECSAGIGVSWPIAFSTLFIALAGNATDVTGYGQQEQAWIWSSNVSGGKFSVACRTQNATMTGSYIAIGMA